MTEAELGCEWSSPECVERLVRSRGMMLQLAAAGA
jgi:hypothetical protein